jgi:predicted restriction endonuclease
MLLITDRKQLEINLATLETYLIEGNEYEIQEATSLIKRGTCFVAYQINKELRFAPSRFIGYEDNTLDIHLKSKKDGTMTNKAIESILNEKPTSNEQLEKMYIDYCLSLGIKPNTTGNFGSPRKFWKLSIDSDFESNSNLSGEFPEGNLVERAHKYRERNSKVIQLAKQNFKNQNGHLYCQICGFDFEKAYGKIGKDFIEAHHTIPVSEISPTQKTRVEDIAILCSNCHRIVHRKRPWLSIGDLSKILNK